MMVIITIFQSTYLKEVHESKLDQPKYYSFHEMVASINFTPCVKELAYGMTWRVSKQGQK
jgi:hypothetical protein